MTIDSVLPAADAGDQQVARAVKTSPLCRVTFDPAGSQRGLMEGSSGANMRSSEKREDLKKVREKTAKKRSKEKEDEEQEQVRHGQTLRRTCLVGKLGGLVRSCRLAAIMLRRGQHTKTCCF